MDTKGERTPRLGRLAIALLSGGSPLDTGDLLGQSIVYFNIFQGLRHLLRNGVFEDPVDLHGRRPQHLQTSAAGGAGQAQSGLGVLPEPESPAAARARERSHRPPLEANL